MSFNTIELKETCGACPEQYDAYIGDTYVGYLRLRHGVFTVDNASGETIMTEYPQGDGMFESEEREGYLNKAKKAILEDMANKILT